MRIVGGKYRGKKITAPLHKGTRPTSDRTREMIFNILLHNPAFGPKVLNDKAILDVFAGTGALGIEALSRGGKSVTFIENDRTALPILYANIKAFNLLSGCVLEEDARSLRKAPSPPLRPYFFRSSLSPGFYSSHSCATFLSRLAYSRSCYCY